MKSFAKNSMTKDFRIIAVLFNIITADPLLKKQSHFFTALIVRLPGVPAFAIKQATVAGPVHFDQDTVSFFMAVIVRELPYRVRSLDPFLIQQTPGLMQKFQYPRFHYRNTVIGYPERIGLQLHLPVKRFGKGLRWKQRIDTCSGKHQSDGKKQKPIDTHELRYRIQVYGDNLKIRTGLY